MRLILIGCEYSGTTTLAESVVAWAEAAMGAFVKIPTPYKVHDHFKLPEVSHPPELSETEHRLISGLTPRLKEMLQRHNVFYHIPRAGAGGDSVMIGLHYEDSVYAPLYFDYLHDLAPDDPIMQTRNAFDDMILDGAPESVLVLVKASPQTIASRIREHPHRRQVIRESDIELVLERFEEEFSHSKLSNKLVIDTTDATVEESLEQLVRGLERYFTQEDRDRLDSHR